MRHGIRKLCGSKVICYAALLICLNKYFSVLLVAKANEKFYVTDLNEILLNIISNSWSNQACVQGFDYESIKSKSAVNMFERMETAEYIYEGVLEPSNEKPTR